MRIFATFATAALVAGVLATTALAAGFFHSVTDTVAAKECGACHMAYPAALLPARSWQKIIDSLDKHFGEDASLPEPARLRILAYMTANAADSQSKDSWFVRGVPGNITPTRITELPFWRSIHGGFPASAFKRASVRKKGNCLGCHG